MATSAPTSAATFGTTPGRLVITTSCVYTTAFLLTVLLHELGHALMGRALGTHPILFNTHVDNTVENLSVAAQVAIALAGPVLSLAQGVVFLRLARRQRRHGSWELGCLFMGVFGLINFLGYLMTAPFVPYGDLGAAVGLLRFSFWLTLPVAIGAAVGLGWLIRRTGSLFLGFVPATAQANRPTKGRVMRNLLLWPWLVGSVLITLLSWPLPTVLSLIYPPLSSMVLGAAFGGAMRQGAVVGEEAPALHDWSWLPVAGLVVVAFGYRLLSTGVAL